MVCYLLHCVTGRRSSCRHTASLEGLQRTRGGHVGGPVDGLWMACRGRVEGLWMAYSGPVVHGGIPTALHGA